MSPEIHLFVEDTYNSDFTLFQFSIKDDVSSRRKPSIIWTYFLVRTSGNIRVIRNILKRLD